MELVVQVLEEDAFQLLEGVDCIELFDAWLN